MKDYERVSLHSAFVSSYTSFIMYKIIKWIMKCWCIGLQIWLPTCSMNDSLELFLKISFFQPGVQFSPISSMFFIPMISIIILMFFCYPCDHYIIIHILNQLVLMEQVCQLCRNVWIVCKGSFIFAVECGALCKATWIPIAYQRALNRWWVQFSPISCIFFIPIISSNIIIFLLYPWSLISSFLF